MYRKKVLQALKVHLRRVGVFTVERRRGEKGLFGYSWIVLDSGERRRTSLSRGCPSRQAWLFPERKGLSECL